MPFRSKTNNRILPANSRSVDVAKQMLERSVPVQQRRYANAFEVNGYETLVYNRLRHGLACSCQNRRGSAATILDESGKLRPGHMDELLTGGLSFKVQPYGTREPMRGDLRAIRGAGPAKHDDQMFDGAEDSDALTDYDIDDDFDSPNTTRTHAADGDVDDVLDDTGQNPDDESEIFDAEEYVNDSKCTVCFGTGFVGGFSLLNGLRLVMSTQWDPAKLSVSGTIEANRIPHAFMADRVDFTVTLPKGVVGVDTLRCWNNDRQTFPSSILIDNLPYSVGLLRAFCDGREHTVSILHDKLTYWTHLELQFNLSTQRALFELPRKTDGSNMQLVEAAEDMQLNVSPMVPNLDREDLLIECTLGKAMVVQSVTDWKTAKREILGWDASIRVLQPSEILNLLPRRRTTHQKSTYMVRDNQDGRRRT